MNADDKNIKFPTHHYVGFQTRPSKDEVPLGFMTPDGTDSAATKRKATVDSWARGYGYDAKNEGALPAKTYENKPMSGFKLGRNVRHSAGGWGQGNVKWRIEDPRGFELEITSPNLAHIIAACTLENGEILEQCMWARLRNENILVPVTTEVYKAAQANTVRLSKSASLSEVRLGDHVILQNGQEGIYMGAYFGVSSGGYYGFNGVVVEPKKKHYIKLTTGAKSYRAKDATASYLMIASPKISEIVPCDTPLTDIEAEQQILDDIAALANFESAGSSYGNSPNAVTTKGGKGVASAFSIALEDATFTDYIQPHTDRVTLAVEFNGNFGVLSSTEIAHRHQYYSGSTNSHNYHANARSYDKAAFDATGEWRALEEEIRGYSYYNSRTQQKLFAIPGSDWSKVKASKIRIKGKTALGNEIDFYA